MKRNSQNNAKSSSTCYRRRKTNTFLLSLDFQSKRYTRLSKAIHAARPTGIQYCMSMQNRRIRLPMFFGNHQEQLNEDRFVFFVFIGFAATTQTLKTIKCKISRNGRKGFSNKCPSDDLVRSSRERNRDITLRKTEKNMPQKLTRSTCSMWKALFKCSKSVKKLIQKYVKI